MVVTIECRPSRTPGNGIIRGVVVCRPARWMWKADYLTVSLVRVLFSRDSQDRRKVVLKDGNMFSVVITSGTMLYQYYISSEPLRSRSSRRANAKAAGLRFHLVHFCISWYVSL